MCCKVTCKHIFQMNIFIKQVCLIYLITIAQTSLATHSYQSNSTHGSYSPGKNYSYEQYNYYSGSSIEVIIKNEEGFAVFAMIEKPTSTFSPEGCLNNRTNPYGVSTGYGYKVIEW
ncbi:uncharacterized protein LOC124355511 [Homalodisca vitripennis]|uniref:uncharacterized protein LOC124355511 n=1 Tax=Homalodisca vitripennis TaxID=197043 RepID=UPI001EECD25E|nr:uncharacterized protein LOC124355511 [Homalodisca vitripennis]